jgi:pimeloyl-ACP methyl ester carboxylesterase
VLALTRRAHGDSDYPDIGYDADTLVEDIRQFLDELNIHQVILAGHSLAGAELTQFAGTYPERVLKLVYLDALDDRRGLPAILEQNPLKGVEPQKSAEGPFTIEEYLANLKANRPDLADIWSELWDTEISHSVKKEADGKIVDRMPENVEKLFKDSLVAYVPVEIKVQIPILSFHSLGESRLPDYLTDEQKQLSHQFNRDVRLPFRIRMIREFQNRFPHAKNVELPDGHHYCFIAQEEIVYDEMKKFLLE